jgi:hypothetical protein
MIDEIIYDSLFLTFEPDKETTTDPITAYSYDGDNYDATITEITGSMGGETSVVFIN